MVSYYYILSVMKAQAMGAPYRVVMGGKTIGICQKRKETADLIWDTIHHWDGDPIDCAEVHNGEEENQDLKICFGEEIK